MAKPPINPEDAQKVLRAEFMRIAGKVKAKEPLTATELKFLQTHGEELEESDPMEGLTPEEEPGPLEGYWKTLEEVAPGAQLSHNAQALRTLNDLIDFEYVGVVEGGEEFDLHCGGVPHRLHRPHRPRPLIYRPVHFPE